MMRTLWYHLKAIPLSIIAFIVVAVILICREPDGNPYLDGGDDGDD